MYFAKACGKIGEIVSAKHAEEKSKKKIIWFLIRQEIYFLAKKVTEICSQTHKKHTNPPNMRGIIPLSFSPPFRVFGTRLFPPPDHF